MNTGLCRAAWFLWLFPAILFAQTSSQPTCDSASFTPLFQVTELIERTTIPFFRWSTYMPGWPEGISRYADAPYQVTFTWNSVPLNDWFSGQTHPEWISPELTSFVSDSLPKLSGSIHLNVPTSFSPHPCTQIVYSVGTQKWQRIAVRHIQTRAFNSSTASPLLQTQFFYHGQQFQDRYTLPPVITKRWLLNLYYSGKHWKLRMGNYHLILRGTGRGRVAHPLTGLPPIQPTEGFPLYPQARKKWVLNATFVEAKVEKPFNSKGDVEFRITRSQLFHRYQRTPSTIPWRWETTHYMASLSYQYWFSPELQLTLRHALQQISIYQRARAYNKTLKRWRWTQALELNWHHPSFYSTLLVTLGKEKPFTSFNTQIAVRYQQQFTFSATYSQHIPPLLSLHGFPELVSSAPSITEERTWNVLLSYRQLYRQISIKTSAFLQARNNPLEWLVGPALMDKDTLYVQQFGANYFWTGGAIQLHWHNQIKEGIYAQATPQIWLPLFKGTTLQENALASQLPSFSWKSLIGIRQRLFKDDLILDFQLEAAYWNQSSGRILEPALEIFALSLFPTLHGNTLFNIHLLAHIRKATLSISMQNALGSTTIFPAVQSMPGYFAPQRWVYFSVHWPLIN